MIARVIEECASDIFEKFPYDDTGLRAGFTPDSLVAE
jgi:hypothetical protein